MTWLSIILFIVTICLVLYGEHAFRWRSLKVKSDKSDLFKIADSHKETASIFWDSVVLRKLVVFNVPKFGPQSAVLTILILVSGAFGWWLGDDSTGKRSETAAMRFAREAARAHLLLEPDVRHSLEFGPGQEDSAMLRLAGRLGRQAHLPDFERIGFELIGSRLLPLAKETAGQFFFEDVSSNRATLYVRKREAAAVTPSEDKVIHYFKEGGPSTIYWTKGPFRYALIGELDRNQLYAAVEMIQQQMEDRALGNVEGFVYPKNRPANQSSFKNF